MLLEISSGHFDPFALPLALIAWGMALAAAQGSSDTALTEPQLRLFAFATLLAVVLQVFPFPAYREPAGCNELPSRVLAAIAAVLVSSYFCTHLRASLIRARFWALLACAAALFAVLIARGDPPIDVFVMQQGGSQALAAGHNPYAAEFPNIYPPEQTALWLSPAWLHGPDRVRIYPYPPLSLLATTLSFVLCGDVRWAMAVAALLVALGLRRLGRKAPLAELAAVFFLFQPRSTLMVAMAWTEHLVLLCALAFALSVRRADGQQRGGAGLVWLSGLSLGALLAIKQYGALLAVPLIWALPAKVRLRAGALAVGLAAATLVPFAVADPGELWRDLGLAQIAQPFRPDALSILALLPRVGLPTPGWLPLLGFVAAAATLAYALHRARDLPQELRLPRAFAIAAAAWLSFVLLNKQAFCNYDELAVGLLLISVVLQSRPADGGPERIAT